VKTKKEKGKVSFTVKCENMTAEWANCFLSMLDRLQYNGSIGHSEEVAIFSDGDGDFRPRFKLEGKPYEGFEKKAQTTETAKRLFYPEKK